MPKKVVTSATWLLPGVGEIKFRRNLRAKRLTISIRPTSGVKVTIPGLLPFRTAKDFVEKKRHWITEKVNEITVTKGFLSNQNSYKTREHLLKFYPEEREDVFVKVIDGEIKVFYPQNLTNESILVQSAAKQGIELAFRKEAHNYLPKRLSELAQKNSFKYNQVRIKNISSRWGSCSVRNNINLSIYLMKLPDDLIDYILLHELAHTVHKNHAPAFWNHLQSITGNAKGLASRVKKYRTGI